MSVTRTEEGDLSVIMETPGRGPEYEIRLELWCHVTYKIIRNFIFYFRSVFYVQVTVCWC